MKSLKKTLSLVLVLVMVLGMFGIASAANFPDDASIQYKEAVGVMTGIGAIAGFPDGTFGPTKTITRAEAAKMVAYAVLGKTVAESLTGVSSSFKDVPASPAYSWAIPSIEYLVSVGAIAGDGQGNFNPTNNVTALELGKMLLVCLGIEGNFTGAGWDLQVGIAAQKAGLFAGRATNANALDKAASREETALYCFNALLYSPIGSTEKIWGIIGWDDTGSTPVPTYGWIDVPAVNTGSIAASVYPTLIPDYTDHDMFGAPAKTWEYKKNDIVSVADDATLTFTAETSAAAMASALKKYSYAASLKAVENGVAVTSISGSADIAGLTANGTVVKLYVTDNVVTDVVVLEYFFEELDITNVAATKAKGAHSVYETTNGKGNVFTTVVDADADKTNVVVTGNVAKGDMVLTMPIYTGVAAKAATLCLFVYEIPTVTGILSSVSNAKVATIGSSAYAKSAIAPADPAVSSKEGTYYVDLYGFYVGVKQASSDTNYAFVIATSTYNALVDGKVVPSYSAVVALADGTVTVLTIDLASYTSFAALSGAAAAASLFATTPAVTYTDANADGKYELTALVAVADKNVYSELTKIVAKANTLTVVTTGGAGDTVKYANSATKFVFTNYAMDASVGARVATGTVTTVTGIASVGDYDSTKAYAVDTNKDGIADIVFVLVDTTAAVADNYVFITGTYTDYAGGIRRWDAIINGAAATVTTPSSYSGLVGGQLYSKIVVSGTTVTPTAINAAGSGASVRYNGGLLFIDSAAPINCGADVPVYVFDTTDMSVSTTTASALTTTRTAPVVVSYAADTVTVTGIYIGYTPAA